MLALNQFETTKDSLDESLSSAVSNVALDQRDQRFMRRLVNGVVKMRRRLDFELKFYLARPSQKLPVKLNNILRLGIYQLRFTDKIPAAAAVNESVNLARYFFGVSQARLVNGVLRTVLREPERPTLTDKNIDPVRNLGDNYSFPDYFVRYCLREFGIEKTESLLESMNQPPGLTIRVNYLKTTPDEVEEILKKAEVNYKKGEFLEEYFTIEEGSLEPVRKILDEGKIYIQDQSAGMPVRLLNPRPGMNVLDLAAAPGGKTTYAASRMRGKGSITAVDKSRKRLKLLVENCERLGIKNVSPVSCDANEFVATKKFERVMVDPPCTGWGNAGKHADLRWVKKPEDIIQMKRIQKRILDHAASLVSPGGILVYSTCSIIREENDQVVEEFLLIHKDFQLESAKKFWDKRVVSERGFLKTYPNIPGLDGAFAARLKLRPN